MFSKVLEDIDDIFQDARNTKYVKRKEFIPLYNAIHEYVAEHKLIMGNVETLVGATRTSTNNYTLYGSYMLRHANSLANKLAAINIYTTMYTNVKNQHFTITVDGTRLLQCYDVHSKYIGALSPVSINDTLVYPPEFELMRIYRVMYSPASYSEWDTYTKHIPVLEKQVRKRLAELSADVKQSMRKKGGKPTPSTFVYNWLKTQTEYALIGRCATDTVTGTYVSGKIQLIATNPEVLVKSLTNVVSQMTGRTPNVKTHRVNIPTDNNLRKTSISITTVTNGKKTTTHLIDVFNSANYELIPYSTFNDVQVAYPDVIKRFILIELWTTRILHSLGVLNKYATGKVLKKASIQMKVATGLSVEDYTAEEFIGNMVDPELSRKRVSVKNPYPKYVPEQYRYNHGKYRTL